MNEPADKRAGPDGGDPVLAATSGAARVERFGRVGAAVREFVDFCRGQPWWVAMMAAFVAAWTIELYLVQETTLVYPNETSASFGFWAPKIRLVLDVLFVSALTIWLRRRWLCVVVVGAFFAYLGLVTYFQYFQRPLSLLTIYANWREGFYLSGFALNLFPKRAALLLALVLAMQVAALYLSRRASLPRNCAWLGGCVLWLAYAALYLVANRLDPLEAIQTTRGVGRLGEIRGYLGPWFAEWYYLSDDERLKRAIELRNVVYDNLRPQEANIPIHDRLVILQAESLDYNVLGYKVDGVEVTPFLNRLRDRSLFYRVRAMHFSGCSSEADFAALNAVSGSRQMNPYAIPGYPYENTTPQLLARHGFATYSFHGNKGDFYNRRPAFEKMGFAGIAFQEELETQYGRSAGRWGIPDADVLAISAQRLRTAPTPTCHFVITLTTHVPYLQLPNNEKEIFAHPRTTAENYINNMRYLDNCLRDYIVSLGSGTTVMIYADHPTEEGNATFSPDRSGGREFIPCFIYDSDQDLSKMQQTRGRSMATDGSLNLVDVINYLRAQVIRTHSQPTNTPVPQPPEPPQKHAAAAGA